MKDLEGSHLRTSRQLEETTESNKPEIILEHNKIRLVRSNLLGILRDPLKLIDDIQICHVVDSLREEH